MRLRSGIALLLTVGTLGVLGLLAAAFSTLTSLERRASQARLDASRVELLARSGLEDAVARLTAGQDPSSQESAYRGEDWDNSGTLNDIEVTGEVVRPGLLDTDGCPVRWARRPSFFRRSPSLKGADGKPAPALSFLEGRQRGESGSLLPGGAMRYLLKVEDESGKIDVNGGFLDIADRDQDGIPDHRDTDVRPSGNPKHTGRGWNAQLARILNLLGMQPEVGIPGLGGQILSARPPGGYASIQKLQSDLGLPASLAQYLTVHGVPDTSVVHPNAFATQAPANSVAEVKLARLPLLPEEGGRVPVNLNAAPRPVLVALLDGLAGTSWFDVQAPHPVALKAGAPGAVADALIAFREGRDPLGLFATAGLAPGPIVTWARFEAFCDALVPAVLNGANTGSGHGGNLCTADLLKANFNPNTRLSKHLPDQLLWRWVDKSDLTCWSTEGALVPGGNFRVSVSASLAGPDGKPKAFRELSTGVEAHRILRQTTQADFVAGRTLPDGYLSLASGLLDTAGIRAGAAWWGGANPGAGLAVMTYPSPPTALPAAAADFDGAVGLATVECPSLDPKDGKLHFLHHFDDGWAAEPVPSNPSGLRNPVTLDSGNDAALQWNASVGVWPKVPGQAPGTLYPDGMHQQREHCPAFDAMSNLPADPPLAGAIRTNHAALGFWVKPIQNVFPPRISFSCLRGDVMDSQFLLLGRMGDDWGFFVENTPLDYRQRIHEREFGTAGQVLLPGARWQLVTGHFNTAVPDLNLDVSMDVRGIRGQGIDDPIGGYNIPFDPMMGMNLAAPDIAFILGGQENMKFTQGKDGDQILDEFAICDFSADVMLALPRVDAWALQRYQDGRYYKGNDGAFLSGVLEPEPGREVRLLRARWTAVLPRERRKELQMGWSGIPASGTNRILDATLAESRVDVDLLDLTANSACPLQDGGGIGVRTRQFRYRVRFLPTPGWSPADRENQPVLESPWFDDLEILYQPASGARIVDWIP